MFSKGYNSLCFEYIILKFGMDIYKTFKMYLCSFQSLQSLQIVMVETTFANTRSMMLFIDIYQRTVTQLSYSLQCIYISMVSAIFELLFCHEKCVSKERILFSFSSYCFDIETLNVKMF